MSKFSSLKPKNTEIAQKLVLLNPITNMPIKDEEGKEAFIMLLSEDSAKAKAYDMKMREDVANRRGRVSPAEVDERLRMRTAALTADWYLVDYTTKAPLGVEFSENNAGDLYSEVSWVLEQVLQFVNNRGNFS